MSDLHNLNDLMAEAEGLALHTSQGSFVKVEDLRRLVEARTVGTVIDEATAFKGKTFHQAHSAIKKDPQFESINQTGPKAPGRSVPAMEPPPPSRA